MSEIESATALILYRAPDLVELVDAEPMLDECLHSEVAIMDWLKHGRSQQKTLSFVGTRSFAGVSKGSNIVQTA